MSPWQEESGLKSDISCARRPAEQPRGKYNDSFGPGVFKNVTTPGSRGLGPVYAAGIAGNWVWCQNGSLPATCVFDDTGRSTIDWFLDELGANHVSHWPVQPQNCVLVYNIARTLILWRALSTVLVQNLITR